ncbi:MAG TPA: carbamate kinase [Longimicrobiales bacterium]
MSATDMIGALSRQPTVVVALGGNALLPAGERGDIHQQFAHTRESLAPIVEMARAGWRIAVVHGNGPQIGDELYRNEMARAQLPPLPLGVLVAATAGWIGYMIQQSLQNALEKNRIDRDVVTLITQVIVDPDDAATHEPIKPIGRVLNKRAAETLAKDLGWTIRPDGSGYRRLVPSPVPCGIVEKEQIKRLTERGTIVIAAGGGGTPVYRHPTLRTEGIDAVIDKDRAAAVLAEAIGADVLLILSNVDGVFQNFGKADQQLQTRLSVAQAKQLLEHGELGKGSMAPKVEAAVSFLEKGGTRAHIARLDHGLQALNEHAGTTITNELSRGEKKVLN